MLRTMASTQGSGIKVKDQYKGATERPQFSCLLFTVAAGENAGHIVEHVGGAFLVVAEVANQTGFDHAIFALCFGIDHVSTPGW